MRNPFFAHYAPHMKLLMLGLIILFSLFFTLLLGIVLAVPFFGTGILESLNYMNNLSDPQSVSLLKYFQVVNQVGLFLLPSFLFAFLVSSSILKYLRFDINPRILTLVGGTMVIFFSLPLIGWLSEINQALELPEFMSGIERWMKRSESEAQKITEAFLSTTSSGGFFMNIIMIAIIPAIGEEILFRSILIRLFREWLKNVHVAVIISAVLFSALHLQFYGFVPRFFLGVILGYLFVWSGSIWVPVIVHFINNAFAVFTVYLAGQGVFETDLESLGTTDHTGLIMASAILVFSLMGLIWYYESKIRKVKF